MTIEEIIDLLGSLDGVLLLRPQPGDGTPEIAWGDVFAYYAPDGVVPNTQPFATIVTKNYPDEPPSGLDSPGAFRVNIAAGATEFSRWVGQEPREWSSPDGGSAAEDVVLAHPVYGGLGWLAVTNPGPATTSAVEDLLRTAHGLARGRFERRARHASGDSG